MKAARIFDWWKFGIVILAAFFRTYRLDAHTEFLGDQGRTMLIMRDFVEQGVIPLVGPATLSGHHLGPMFYYLLLPGYILFGGNPLGMSLWMVILGVFAVWVLYEVAKRMFGYFPARAVTLLWAVSPYIIPSDRVIWEPNVVPLFSLLFVYLLYRAHTGHIRWAWVALGVVNGVLVQLHYPNVFFIGLLGLYFVGGIIFRFRKAGHVLQEAGLWILGFLAVLIPFLWYESTVGFRDIAGITSVIVSGGGKSVGKRVMVDLWFGYAFRVMGRALPFMSRAVVAVLLVLWLVFAAFRPTKKHLMLTAWFIGGLTPMARFSGVVHDHYLFFLLPVPFLMIAAVLSKIKRPVWRYVAVFVIGIAGTFQLIKTDIFQPGRYDIVRVSTAVQRIRDVVGDARFSFTLTNSKSYSDLHYRYYMEVVGLVPEPITGAYQNLILVCDRKDCPPPRTMMKEQEVQILCFEEHCSGQYPKIPLLDEWKYTDFRDVSSDSSVGGRIYVFQRRPK